MTLEASGPQKSPLQSPKNGNETPNEVVVQPSNERERARTAALTLAIFWGLALISLIIPYANLVLTPLLFVLGPFAAWKASQRTRSAYVSPAPEESGSGEYDEISHLKTVESKTRPPIDTAPPIRNGAANDRRNVS